MEYRHHQMTIELPLKGIVTIDHIHLRQGLNCHGQLSLRATLQEEEAIRLVEEEEELWIKLRAETGGEERVLFCGRAGTQGVIRKNGLLVLCARFFGGTRQWDMGEKSQSFCRLQKSYGEVFGQVLKDYPKAELLDESSGGAVIGRFLLQYEETDWSFLKRLASHLGTVLVAQDSDTYGKAYFGLPRLERGRVLENREYTLLNRQKGREEWAEDLLPQELYRWEVVSEELLSLGEGVHLGHIPVVVTGIERETKQGRVEYTYTLSRRKGIIQKKVYNPKIYGMSIPATIRERKGNQVRLQLAVDKEEEQGEDRAWFTYCLETSNFYCMPEIGSLAHLYFPDQDEANAIVVHALRQTKDGAKEEGKNPQGEASVGTGASFPVESAKAGDSSPGSGAGRLTTYAAETGEAAPSAKETQEAKERDPAVKVFSDPSGSFLQLAPGGVTLSAGSGASLVMTGKGQLSLSGKSLTLNSDSTLLMGRGKKGKLPQLYLEAGEALKVSLTGKDSQILLEERAEILAAFIKKEASSRRLATPYATQIRAQVTAGDSALRSQINSQVQGGLTEYAKGEKERLLAEKKEAAETKIREGIFSLLTVVASVAVVVATGGAAAPLVAAMAVTGGFKAVSAVADISEGLSDLDRVEAGDLSPSYHFMRDGVFGGNEGLYQTVKGVNDLVFGLVTGKAVAGNLSKLEKLEDATGFLKKVQQGQKYLKDHKQVKIVLNIGSEAGLGAVEEYVATGGINPANVGVNIVTGKLKGMAMQRLTIPCKSPLKEAARKVINTGTGTLAGMGIDYFGSALTGQPYDRSASFQQNLMVSALGEMVGEPIDAASGAFLLEATDLRLPGIREELRLKRTYTSTRKQAGWFGRGWQCPYESRLYRDKALFHVTLPSGLVCAFVENEGEAGEAERGYRDTLGGDRFSLKRKAVEKCWLVEDHRNHNRYVYDEAGRLLVMEEANHQRTTLSYKGEQGIQLVTPLGGKVFFTLQEGKVVRAEDHTGRKLSYRYAGEFLMEVVHPEGGRSCYHYDEQGYLSKPVDQTGLTYLTNTYDGRGRVTLQTLANGETYRLTHQDRKGQVEVEYSAYPGVTTYCYNPDKTIGEIRYPDGTKTVYGYDEARNRILVVDRLGHTTRMAYDALGRLVQREQPGGLVTRYGYDGAGDLIEITDNAGARRVLSYDACHNLITRRDKVQEGEESCCVYTYDEKGRLLCETDGEGNRTRYGYEENSAYPSVTTYADGTSLFCTYSETGRLLSEEDGAVAYTYGYNPGGYRIWVKDGEGGESRYHYDGMGRLVSTYTPKQVKEGGEACTRYRYDFLDRLTETHYPDGSREVLKRDGEGNILKRIHPNAYDPRTGEGEGTQYRYNQDHHLLAVLHPDGGMERFYCDARGNRIRHILPEQYEEKTDGGAGYSYTYDEEDRLTTVTGPGGELLAAYTYDLHGNCTTYRDEQGALHHYRYDCLGNRLQELKAVEKQGTGAKEGGYHYRRTDYGYDKNGNCIRQVRYGGTYDQEGQLLRAGKDLVLAFVYDARNRLVEVTDSEGAKVAYAYDARGNKIKEEQLIFGVDPKEEGSLVRKFTYHYDRAGRLVEKRELLDNGLGKGKPTWAVTRYGYDENGNRIHILTPEGYVLYRTFDERDRLAEETLVDEKNAIRLTTSLTYDKAGNIVRLLQQGGEGKRELSCTYDLQERLTRIQELDGPVFAYGYDGNGNRVEERRLLPAEEEQYQTTHYAYDFRGNLLKRTRQGQVLEAYGYDGAGNRTAALDADGVGVSLCYGLDGQVKAVTSERAKKAGRVSQRLSYDARGRITGLEEAGEVRTGFWSDGWGRIQKVATAEGGKQEYTYDAAGNLRTAKDGLGRVTRYTYTSNGRVSSITDPLGKTEYFGYDKEGRQVRHVDRKGTTTETRYNVYGKPVYQVCIDKKGKRQVMGSWRYDDFGHLKEARAGGFTYTYIHRPDGKLLTKTSNGKVVLSCTYYKEGSVKSLTDEAGKSLHYTYDEEGRLKSLQTEKGRVLARYGYTLAGRIATIESENGIHTHYTYDEEGNLKSLTIGKGEEWLLYAAHYTYDLRGNRLTKRGQRLGESESVRQGRLQPLATTYTYDTMNRLIKEERPEGGESYTYDLAGNRLSRCCYHYAPGQEGGERKAAVDFTEGYCYNEANQLTRREDGRESTSYTYDEQGNLVKEVTVQARGGQEEQRTLYHYDLLNRQKQVELPGGSIQTSHYDGEGLRAGLTTDEGEKYTFLYHQGELLREEKAGEFSRSYFRGHGLVGLETEEGGCYSCHLDEQQSTIYVTGSGAEVENAYRYDAFGNLLAVRERFYNRIRYTGQQHEQETKQYYLRARYYHPALGRFMQEDTYRGDGLNLYAYCGNNPVRYFDPSGHEKICPKGESSCAGTDTQAKKVNESGRYSGTGEYGDVGGHHVHAKAGFKGDVNYDPKKGFSISQDFMKENGLDHNIMTSKQRELFKELYESGRPNTLEEHTRIAREALKAGGASDSMIDDLINASLKNLSEQGVTAPTRIPWYSK